MNTPICDFVRRYARSDTLRLHMPGHKGIPFLGMEKLDITEISGADSLYEADGIIAESEANASRLFGCRTYYSTEGASQCIRAIVYLLMLQAKQLGRRPVIAAGRNAHKTFVTAAALLDLEVTWLHGDSGYLSCDLSAEQLDVWLKECGEKPFALYLTSPDYLGKMVDIGAIAAVCHRHGVLLAVDNAHGAYLKFLGLHPIELGADICCDSAHKTLPALTGAAYLHLSEKTAAAVGTQVRNAMMAFGSTSPSYLILQSLDAVNAYLEKYPQRLRGFVGEVRSLKTRLEKHGYCLYGNEPLKLTVDARAYGYTGVQLAEYLRQNAMEPEFADPDYLVLMLTPEIGTDALKRIETVLCLLPQKEALPGAAPQWAPGEQVLSPREAMLSDSETLPVSQCLGRILAVPTVGCPPAVPILVSGERITERALACFAYYGISTCCVVKEKTLDLGRLGFGFLRLPHLDPNDSSTVDLSATEQMVDLFLARGFRYFDTAYIYLHGRSEEAVRKTLVERHPRDSFLLATKLHCSTLKKGKTPEEIFEEQFHRCGVSYFDVYLLHGLDGEDADYAEKQGCFGFLQELKRQGKVRWTGFSFHDRAQVLDRILTRHPEIDVVQLQLNYLDWDNPIIQSGACYEVCRRHGKPIIVMEPVKGGTLADVPEQVRKLFAPEAPAHRALRFAASREGVAVVLSGMSTVEQVDQNTRLLEPFVPLTEEERSVLPEAARIIRKTVAIPCTGCGYCTRVCPAGIPIPSYFSLYNERKRDGWQVDAEGRYAALAQEHPRASCCIGCGKCARECPQKLDVPGLMKQVASVFDAKI